MSVQLREPIRSLGRRRIIISKKPWPLYFRSTFTAQGNNNIATPHSIPPTKWPIIYRAYNTSTATATTSTTISEQVPVKKTSTTITTAPKSNALKFWQQYQQQQQQQAKDAMTSKEFEHLLSTLFQQAQTSSRKSVFWNRIIQVYETANQLQLHSTPNIYLTAMTAYGRIGNSQQVMALFKEYKNRFRLKDNAHQQYFAAIVDSNDFTTALNVFRDIKSNPNLSVMNASICLKDLINALCVSSTKKSNVYIAIKAVEEMKHSMADWDPQSRQQITESLWQGYQKLLHKSFDTAITPLSAETLLATYIENPSISTKIIPCQLFTLFNLLCHQSNGFVPTAKTCNLMLENQLLDKKNYGSVKCVLSWMQKLDIEPTSSTVAILLRTFGSRLPIHQAEQLYDKSLKQGAIDADFFKNYLKVFASDGALVKSVLKDVRQHGIEVDTTWHATMTQSFVQRGELDQGFKWLQQVKCKDLDCFATIMEAWLQRGQWQKCSLHYETLLQQAENVDTHRRIVKCALAAGFAENKPHLLDHIKIKFTPNTVMRIVNNLLCLESKHGHALVPGGIIVKSLKMMESKLHVYLDAEGIRRMILGLGNRGNCQHAFAVYKYVREGGHEHVRAKRCASSHIYLALMTSATKNNDIRILERAWVDMQYRKRFYGNKSKDKELHTLARYNILLNGYASQLPKPDLTGVKRVFQRLLNQQLAPDTVTYNILIKAFVNANNMDAANQILQQQPQRPQQQPNIRATNTILNGWIIQKNWDQVEKLVKQQPVDMVTFNLLIQNFLNLDSKSMSYMHILKNKHQWHELDKLKKSKPNMSSQTIWSIFESATGYTRHGITNYKQISIKNESNSSLCKQLKQLESKPSPPPPTLPPVESKNAFVKLFSKSTEAAADQVTYKLFMKAFVNIGDYEAASDVYQWMQYSLKL